MKKLLLICLILFCTNQIKAALAADGLGFYSIFELQLKPQMTQHNTAAGLTTPFFTGAAVSYEESYQKLHHYTNYLSTISSICAVIGEIYGNVIDIIDLVKQIGVLRDEVKKHPTNALVNLLNPSNAKMIVMLCEELLKIVEDIVKVCSEKTKMNARERMFYLLNIRPKIRHITSMLRTYSFCVHFIDAKYLLSQLLGKLYPKFTPGQIARGVMKVRRDQLKTINLTGPLTKRRWETYTH